MAAKNRALIYLKKAAPLKTLEKAIQHENAGDTVHLMT